MNLDSKDKEYAARFSVLLRRYPVLSIAALVLSSLERLFGKPPEDTDLEKQVKAARFQALVKHTPLPATLGLILYMSLAVVLYLWGTVQHLMIWMLCKFLTLSIRSVYVSWLDKQEGIAGSPKMRRYYLFLLCILAADGLVWGALVWAVTPLINLTAENIHIFMTTMGLLWLVTTIRGFTLGIDTKALMAFVLPMMLPNIVMAWHRHDLLGLVTMVGFTAFVVLNALGSWQVQYRYLNLLRLRIRSEQIAEEKSQAMELSRIHGTARTRFLAAVSHEMRTPLHGILGLTRVLMQEEPSVNQQQKLALIESSGEHLLTVINDILDFSKIESGRMTMDSRPFDLNSLLVDVVSVFHILGQRKGIHVSYKTAWEGPWHVMGDAGRLRQIMNNLLGNAVKFTEQGHVFLQVTAVSKNHYQFVIQDTGQGIAEDQIPFIFEPFMQGHSQSTQQLGGTGLGLSIAREMCRSMRGDLVCNSVLGQGTSFTATIFLPPVDKEEPKPTFQDTPNVFSAWLDTSYINSPQNDLPNMNNRQSTSAKVVLLVEDNPVNVMLAQAMLEKLGYAVFAVTDGQQAVDWLNEKLCDVVLMDCSMPVMDGIEATRRIRQREKDEQRAHVPIVAVTANNMTQEREACLNAGMDFFLLKPFDETSLAGSIARAVRNVALAKPKAT